MFLGAALLNVAALTTFLSGVLPPRPSDPSGIFDRPLKQYYDYIVGNKKKIYSLHLVQFVSCSQLKIIKLGMKFDYEIRMCHILKSGTYDNTKCRKMQ